MNFIHRISEVDGQWSDTDLLFFYQYNEKGFNYNSKNIKATWYTYNNNNPSIKYN